MKSTAVVSEKQALELLKAGELVALPTETVYGLAGRTDNDQALQKIFATKSRPFFDPLIVHVKDQQQGEDWANWDETSRKLAEEFWPGPLTLVLPKKPRVSDLITSGGPTVALRSPNHPVFQNLLQQLGTPLAAPSANMFGRTSPTEASHVVEEFNGQIPVVDGGLCFKGIESTVVQVNEKTKTLRILRPGIINGNDLHLFLQKLSPDWKVMQEESSLSPGHLKNHYQPTVPLVIVRSSQPMDPSAEELLQWVQKGAWQELVVDNTAALAARQLYGTLRDCSKKGQPLWVQFDDKVHQQASWAGYWDRLQKASVGALVFEKGHWRYQEKA